MTVTTIMGDKLVYLKLLLSALPESLPTGSSTEYPILDFQPDPEHLEEEGLSPAVQKLSKRVSDGKMRVN